PCDHRNASVLRELFPFTRPRVMGLTPAIGTGDRIGLATPGHIRALRKFGIFPVLAQQSIREMARTSRSPREVIDDVSWAVFQEGYRGGFAADADHLKSEEDVNATFRAGFTMYTIDPSDYVDNGAGEYDLSVLKDKFAKLPWRDLECDGDDYYRGYLRKVFRLSDGDRVLELEFTEEELLRAAVKYSAAIAHTARLKRRLERLFGGGEFDLEMSVDETDVPTSPLEHFFIASELKRLGVRVQGLALRFVGEFEKAVDYIGDLEEFERNFRDHVTIARSCGPYKLSIHSGSDKFSIYPIMGRLARELIHLKTAGTSYLEALRVVARHDPSLFREIVGYSIGRFERDRETYHVSAELSSIPDPEGLADGDLERAFLDEDDGRQLLHVTYGSVLTAKGDGGGWLFRERIKEVLIDNEEEYYKVLAAHFERHIKALGMPERVPPP
ncbi:TPA: hypothetical protein EYP44_01980, partial [Candidatus Bathyarchaeota archaeon]|nr:hypothetical protein [Candidatus Bathyarchaeota archaeon]